MRGLQSFLFILLLIAGRVMVGSLSAQPAYDLRLLLTHNDHTVGGHLDVTVQMRARPDTFRIGSSNLVFMYNTAGLSSPVLQGVHHFSGGFYNNLTVTEPIPGLVSTNIELFVPNRGSLVPDTFIDINTIRFTITDSTQTTGLVWRTENPNATTVFADDETNLIPAGELLGLDTAIAPIVTGIPPVVKITRFALHPNFPNPFNPATTIEYDLPRETDLSLVIFDIQGREVRTLVNGRRPRGRHRVRWDGRDASGKPVASGIYIYQLRTPEFVHQRKMLLLK